MVSKPYCCGSVPCAASCFDTSLKRAQPCSSAWVSTACCTAGITRVTGSLLLLAAGSGLAGVGCAVSAAGLGAVFSFLVGLVFLPRVLRFGAALGSSETVSSA